MTATPSPAPQPAADGAVKTCDAGGMAMIHRYYRAGFGEGPTLVRGVAAGNLPHAEVVGTELATLSSSLHVHHEVRTPGSGPPSSSAPRPARCTSDG